MTGFFGVYYLETSKKLLLSFPPALPRGRNAFVGGYLLGHPIIENYLKNGFPIGADCPKT